MSLPVRKSKRKASELEEATREVEEAAAAGEKMEEEAKVEEMKEETPKEGGENTTTTEPTEAGKPEEKDGDEKMEDAEKPVAVKEEDSAAAAATETATEAALAAATTLAEASSIAVGGKTTKDKAAVPPISKYIEEDEYEEEIDPNEVIQEDSDNDWNKKLVDLLMYKHQYRTLHVQATYDPALFAWVELQRKLYRRHRKFPSSVGPATVRRLLVLETVHFPFTIKGTTHWERFFEKLKEYKAKHGHCLVPRLCEFPGLGDWVIDMRRQYKLMMQGKPSILDPERQRRLEEVGFCWVVRNRPEWNNRYEELLKYKEKHGDTRVPQHYRDTPGLGKWVAKQREQYRLLQQGKHSFLTADRLEKLRSAGFVWTVRKEDTGLDVVAPPPKRRRDLLGAVKREQAELAKQEMTANQDNPPALGGEAKGSEAAVKAEDVSKDEKDGEAKDKEATVGEAKEGESKDGEAKTEEAKQAGPAETEVASIVVKL